MPKCDFNKVAKQSKFAAYSEYLFLGTPVGGCFWTLSNMMEYFEKNVKGTLMQI